MKAKNDLVKKQLKRAIALHYSSKLLFNTSS